MSSNTCLSSFGARLFVLAPRFPWFPSLCCAESKDSIYEKFNSVNSFAATPVLPFFLPSVLFSDRDPMYCTLSF